MSEEVSQEAAEPAAKAEGASQEPKQEEAAAADPAKPEAEDAQAVRDRIAGSIRREYREKLDAKEKRILELEAKETEFLAREHDSLLDSLATGGVKRERLEKTGLTGDDLKAFAEDLRSDLAELSQAKPGDGKAEPEARKEVKLGDILGGSPAGVALGSSKALTLEEAMAQAMQEIEGAKE